MQKKEIKKRSAEFVDGPHTQSHISGRWIGAGRAGAAYFSYKQCIKQKKNQSESGKNVFILSPVKLFDVRGAAVSVCAQARELEQKSLDFKKIRATSGR